ncbi:MAG: M48 family metalloprotease [Planctomycetota bacterium]
MRSRAAAAVLGLVVAVSAVVMPLGGCAVNPATGRTQFILMSRASAIQTGEELAPQFTAEYGGSISDADVVAYVRDIGERMAATTEGDNPSLPWQFTVLDSDVINAFALPGGKVFISRGLAARMRNEAQLAGVIGHEIGHVTARHVNDRMAQSALAQGGQVLLDALLSGQGDAIREVAANVYGLGGQTTILAWGRGQELESDALGMRYMTNVGYNPRGQRQVMEILARATGGDGRPAEWQSTHPYPETRIDMIDALLAEEYPQEAQSADGFFASRFEQRMLSRIGRIEASLGDPVHWCAVCASKHSKTELAKADPPTQVTP